ncbi:MAG: TIM barrel protein [Planctomycetes bacterium]|nr:TIM barrel protein [Planctomycetota bacterium]
MKYSICVDAVFEGKDLAESLDCIKRLGFKGFEFWGWWDKDIPALVEKKNALDLEVTACCTRFVSLVDPARRSEYLEGLGESLETAKTLGCSTLISQVGDEIPGVPREAQRDSLIKGLRACVPLLESAGVTLVFEPLNTYVDHPGYFLTQSAEAFDIVDAVASAHVKVIYDIYHQQIMEGNIIPTITEHMARIGHFHSAGHPGRHELDCGEIHYPDIIKAIEQTPYSGWFGIEYFPTQDPKNWLPTLHTWTA